MTPQDQQLLDFLQNIIGENMTTIKVNADTAILSKQLRVESLIIITDIILHIKNNPEMLQAIEFFYNASVGTIKPENISQQEQEQHIQNINQILQMVSIKFNAQTENKAVLLQQQNIIKHINKLQQGPERLNSTQKIIEFFKNNNALQITPIYTPKIATQTTTPKTQTTTENTTLSNQQPEDHQEIQQLLTTTKQLRERLVFLKHAIEYFQNITQEKIRQIHSIQKLSDILQTIQTYSANPTNTEHTSTELPPLNINKLLKLLLTDNMQNLAPYIKLIAFAQIKQKEFLHAATTMNPHSHYHTNLELLKNLLTAKIELQNKSLEIANKTYTAQQDTMNTVIIPSIKQQIIAKRRAKNINTPSKHIPATFNLTIFNDTLQYKFINLLHIDITYTQIWLQLQYNAYRKEPAKKYSIYQLAKHHQLTICITKNNITQNTLDARLCALTDWQKKSIKNIMHTLRHNFIEAQKFLEHTKQLATHIQQMQRLIQRTTNQINTNHHDIALTTIAQYKKLQQKYEQEKKILPAALPKPQPSILKIAQQLLIEKATQQTNILKINLQKLHTAYLNKNTIETIRLIAECQHTTKHISLTTDTQQTVYGKIFTEQTPSDQIKKTIDYIATAIKHSRDLTNQAKQYAETGDILRAFTNLNANHTTAYSAHRIINIMLNQQNIQTSKLYKQNIKQYNAMRQLAVQLEQQCLQHNPTTIITAQKRPAQDTSSAQPPNKKQALSFEQSATHTYTSEEAVTPEHSPTQIYSLNQKTEQFHKIEHTKKITIHSIILKFESKYIEKYKSTLEEFYSKTQAEQLVIFRSIIASENIHHQCDKDNIVDSATVEKYFIQHTSQTIQIDPTIQYCINLFTNNLIYTSNLINFYTQNYTQALSCFKDFCKETLQQTSSIQQTEQYHYSINKHFEEYYTIAAQSIKQCPIIVQMFVQQYNNTHPTSSQQLIDQLLNFFDKNNIHWLEYGELPPLVKKLMPIFLQGYCKQYSQEILNDIRCKTINPSPTINNSEERPHSEPEIVYSDEEWQHSDPEIVYSDEDEEVDVTTITEEEPHSEPKIAYSDEEDDATVTIEEEPHSEPGNVYSDKKNNGKKEMLRANVTNEAGHYYDQKYKKLNAQDLNKQEKPSSSIETIETPASQIRNATHISF